MKDQIENNYGVPKALWKKLKDDQKIVYNNVRFQGKIDTMSHPKAKISIEEWDTIAHNFALLAAWEK